MDVFLMVRKKKQTIFIDAKDTTTVLELKKIIEGITKTSPKNQRLHSRDSSVMEDEKQLQDYGLTSTTAKVQNPATVGLTTRNANGDFDPLELTPYSAPPDLPDVMKSQEINVVSDMPSENRYTVKIPRGETIYYATESSTSFHRSFFGSSRAFKMELHDATQQLALTIKRNLACGTCCTCWVHLQLIEVFNGNGQYLGCTEQKTHCSKPFFSVKDKFNNTVYRILGPTKVLCCNPEYLNYQIFTENGTTQVGSIVHQWDAMQVSYNTILQFPNRRINNDLKASLIGAAFLMEYMYFQNSRRAWKCIC